MVGRSRTGKFPVLFFRAIVVRTVVALLVAGHSPLGAQFPVRSWLPWRTIQTEHFALHYPLELEAWTRDVATRIEAIDSAVTRLVGFTPPRKTDVVVDDPFQSPNGSAWPYLRRPLVQLWASAPSPRDDISEYREWGQMLISHEFGHIVHLTRPSRNPTTRRIWETLPADIGPIAIRAPRWVVEGYATFIEGRVTGSGRPHGAWRSAFLRQWALEGQLPRYDQLDDWGAYAGGSFAYLAGSAFIEWLVERRGDSSLVNVWRRLSAKQTRSFDEAFTGVYGQSAVSLYGQFSVELIEKSLDVARAVAAAGRDTGAIVQRLSRSTGDPAISADGKRVVLVTRSTVTPSHVVIWKTAPEPDSAKRRRDSLLLKADPEDVPARSIYPPGKTALFTLRAPGGASYDSPRFMSDGRVLLWRSTARGDGSYADDLYIWDPPHHHVARVTAGGSVRDADPAPNARSAVATRCRGGWCSLVTVDLTDGEVSPVLDANEHRTFYRPRLSANGRTVLVGVHQGGVWRVATVDVATHDLTMIDPDDGINRYDAAWAGPERVVAVSERGGIANIVQIDVANHDSRTLSTVTGAAVAPEMNPADSSVWFLSLYSGGYDLRRLPPTNTPVVVPNLAAARLAPALSARPIDSVRFGINAVSEPRPFGLTPRLFRWIPLPSYDADGANAALALVSRDIIGRSEVILTGGYGDAASWRGGSLSASWSGMHPTLHVAGFDASQQLSDSHSVVFPIPLLDVTTGGGEADVNEAWQFDTWAARVRFGGSAGRIRGASLTEPDVRETSGRSLLFGDAALAATQRGDLSSVTESLGGTFAGGHSFETGFSRGLVTAGFTSDGPRFVPMSASVLYGRTNTDAPLFEQFALGGGPSTLIDRPLLAQRIAMPVLPTGISIGSSVFAYRAALVTAPFSWYWWSGSTAGVGERFSRWNRVIGLDWTMAVGSIAAAGTPAARGQFGVGESLDAPFRKKVRAYVSLVLNP